MTRFLITLLVFFSIHTLKAQQKIGDRWVDHNLTFKVTDDQVKSAGIFTFCIYDTSRQACIENLSTGIEVKVYDKNDVKLWEGIGSGRAKTLKLAQPVPDAFYLTIKAFKPYVVNKSTSSRIYQEKPIELKYFIK